MLAITCALDQAPCGSRSRSMLYPQAASLTPPTEKYSQSERSSSLQLVKGSYHIQLLF